MNIGKIEENVKGLIKSPFKEEFIYDLLLAYGLPKASITRLKDGAYNLSKKKRGAALDDGNEIIWKKKLFFREVFKQDLHACIDQMRHDENAAKHSPRFVVVTDYETLLAYDTKTKDTLDTPLEELTKYFDFFLPWSGREKAQHKLENPADVKAAEKMAKFYDLIRQDNPDQFLDYSSLHELNVFLSRLLFCYFAEDTEIFPKKLFVNSILSHTQDDGSDLAEYLNRLFGVLNTNYDARKDLPEYLSKFEYVNGGLFGKESRAPRFSQRSRKMLIECGELDWSEINPDIFGSMIQAVVHPDRRGGMGMHYTSVSNIMKVIEPLFLNELHNEFDESQNNPQKLDKLLNRLSSIRIFDPACGSGNFLIIAYKQLRLHEIKILRRISSLNGASESAQLFSHINLSQFYGIELDDFAHEIAVLSLWLAEHQMNVKFNEEFKKKLPSLPLKQGGKVICDNATQINWEDVCPKDEKHEVYILGNPPYIGARNQSTDQKDDVCKAFGGREEYKDSDYVACWLLKGAEYIQGSNSKYAFVATNSVSQGEQVAYIWPHIFSKGLELGFAYSSFKWSNNAKANAGVTCVIVGIRNSQNAKKIIYNNETSREVQNITPYLTAGKTVFVHRASMPISGLPEMVIGNMARDGGHLILSEQEKDALVKEFPQSKKIIRKLMGTQELISGQPRYCLWIEDEDLTLAKTISPVRNRINKVYDFRVASKAKTTNGYSKIPHKFAQRCLKHANSIIVPSTTSERRTYVPMGFLEPGVVITNSANAIFNAETYVFGIVSSRMHMVWVRSVGGQLETRIRYSAEICYNTFPIVSLSEKQKETIATHVFNVLEEREKHPEKTIEELYDPEKMPKDLLEAHEGLDSAVERCYRIKPFSSDEERLEYLFRLYETITSKENIEEPCLI